MAETDAYPANDRSAGAPNTDDGAGPPAGEKTTPVEDVVHLDASVPPNQELIRKAWKETISAPERIEKASREQFRQMTGVKTPSSVVRSAEGITQFDGLYQNGNGALSAAARIALKEQLKAFDPTKHGVQQG